MIAKKCIDFFADRYNISLTVGDVYLKIPNEVVLCDVEMLDSCGNMLLSANDFKAYVGDFSIRRNFVLLSEVELNNPFINAYIDENGVGNYEYFLNKLPETDSTDININLMCKKIRICNGRLKFRDERDLGNESAFNINDVDIEGFSTEISNFKYLKDTLQVNVEHFSLGEKSGIAINDISGKLKYYDKGIVLNDFSLSTNFSRLLCSEISVEGVDNQYLKNPVEKIDKAIVDIDTLIFSMADLAPFFPEYSKFSDSLRLSGNFSGKLSNFKFKNFKVSAMDNTKLEADLSVNGFPNVEQTIVFGNIRNLVTDKHDISQVLRIFAPGVNLPQIDIERLSFNGNITGMLNDMVAYGRFNSDLGSISTDIALMPDWADKSLAYDGKVSTNGFRLSNILSNKDFGNISFNANIKGSVDSLSRTNNEINVQVTEFDFRQYKYSGITAKGSLSNQHFDGSLEVADPNLNVEAIGRYDFGRREQVVDFVCDVSGDLKNLNLAGSGVEDSKLEFVVGANLNGDLLNRPKGKIFLSQTKYNIDDNSLEVNRLDINSSEDERGIYSISGESDFIDFDITGNYVLSEIYGDIKEIVVQTAPVFFSEEPEAHKCKSDFSYSFRIKRINDFVKFFDRNLKFGGDIYTTKGFFNGP
ncbi:MAG: hypothetical protein HUK15_03670, partial [Bacteroidales bacterium]|nr:hypothetical protein [Bacteroidales bacterium]